MRQQGYLYEFGLEYRLRGSADADQPRARHGDGSIPKREQSRSAHRRIVDPERFHTGWLLDRSGRVVARAAWNSGSHERVE